MAFHPNFPTDPRVFIYYIDRGTGRPAVGVHRDGRWQRRRDDRRRPPSRILLDASNKPVRQSQRRRHRLRSRWLSVPRHRRRRRRRRSATGTAQRLTTLLGKMLRIQIGAPGAALHDSRRQSLRGQCAVSGGRLASERQMPGDLRLGLAQSLALELRSRSNGTTVGRRRGPGRMGGSRTPFSAAATTAGVAAKARTTSSTAGCPASGLIDPVAEYDHDARANPSPAVTCIAARSPRRWSGATCSPISARAASGHGFPIRRNPSSREPTQLLQTTLNISSFGQGNDGELYVVNYTGGTLHRINFQGGGGGGTVPTTLSATGCVNPTNATQPASGLIPYAINAPFWSDSATKERWMALAERHRTSPSGPTTTGTSRTAPC